MCSATFHLNVDQLQRSDNECQSSTTSCTFDKVPHLDNECQSLSSSKSEAKSRLI